MQVTVWRIWRLLFSVRCPCRQGKVLNQASKWTAELTKTVRQSLQTLFMLSRFELLLLELASLETQETHSNKTLGIMQDLMAIMPFFCSGKNLKRCQVATLHQRWVALHTILVTILNSYSLSLHSFVLNVPFRVYKATLAQQQSCLGSSPHMISGNTLNFWLLIEYWGWHFLIFYEGTSRVGPGA